MKRKPTIKVEDYVQVTPEQAPFGPASPSSQNIMDSSYSIESVNEMYEKYKNQKDPDNSFIREIKKKDVDVESYIRSSLERPKAVSYTHLTLPTICSV